MNNILLPGTNYQVKFLKEVIGEPQSPVLFVGSGNEMCAADYSAYINAPVEHIVEDYESMINAKLLTTSNNLITTRIMDFTNTDFDDNSFSLVFAQASTSNFSRNKIVKELRRVLKPGGIYCVGETIKTKKHLPTFAMDIIESSEMNLLHSDEIQSYYELRNFSFIDEKEVHKSLDEYYETANNLMRNSVKQMDETELKYNKKIIKKIKHETEAYLKNGFDKYISFKILILKKNESEQK